MSKQALRRLNACGVLEGPCKKVVVAGAVAGFGGKKETVHHGIQTCLLKDIPNARGHAAYIVPCRHRVKGCRPCSAPFFADDIAVNDNAQGERPVPNSSPMSRVFDDGNRFVQLVALLKRHFELLEASDHRHQQHQGDEANLERLGGKPAGFRAANGDLARLLQRQFLAGKMSMRAARPRCSAGR